MKIELRKMNKEEYDEFYNRSFEHHVLELMDEEHMSREDAEKETENELGEMLPQGLETEDNFLMTIRRKDDDAQIGFIWTLHELTEGVKHIFLCDFEIYGEFRRKGYASDVLKAIEEDAYKSGCKESVLFVTNDNKAANILYEKSGYVFLREMGYGKYMKKKIG